MKEQLLKIAGQVSSEGSRDRLQIAAEVFRPSHILPTYSVEQFGMIELQQVRSGHMYSVLLFSKWNQIFFAYFDPEKISLDILNT